MKGTTPRGVLHTPMFDRPSDWDREIKRTGASEWRVCTINESYAVAPRFSAHVFCSGECGGRVCSYYSWHKLLRTFYPLFILGVFWQEAIFTQCVFARFVSDLPRKTHCQCLSVICKFILNSGEFPGDIIVGFKVRIIHVLCGI